MRALSSLGQLRPLPQWRWLPPLLRRCQTWLVTVWRWWPLTALGSAVLCASLAALLWFGRKELDLVLFVVGIGGLALCATTALLVLASAFWLRRRIVRAQTVADELHQDTFEVSRRSSHIQLDTLHWGSTGFRYRPPRRLPWIRTRWVWDQPTKVSVRWLPHFRQVSEQVWATQRGFEERVLRSCHIEDVFGICRVSISVPAAHVLRILPHVGGLQRVAQHASLVHGEDNAHPLGHPLGDRIDLRRYAPGDPARSIHWKAYGRTRKLIVRTPERALHEVKRTLFYFIPGPDDEAAAAMTRALCASNDGDWVLGIDGLSEEANHREAAFDLIARSRSLVSTKATGRVRNMPTEASAAFTDTDTDAGNPGHFASQARPRSAGAGLLSFLQKNQSTGPASLIVCASANTARPSDDWTGFVKDALAKRAGSSQIYLANDGLIRRDLHRWSAVVSRSKPDVPPLLLRSLLDTLRKLEALRSVLLVVDRRNGMLQRPHDLERHLT